MNNLRNQASMMYIVAGAVMSEEGFDKLKKFITGKEHDVEEEI